MSGDEFCIEQSDGLTTITLCRPDEGNRLSIDGVRALTEVLREAAGPLLLTGEGPDFCLGRAAGPSSSDPAIVLDEVLQPILDLYQAVDESRATIVTAVHGRAHGLGFALAAATDVILAERTARFALPEIRAGFPPLLVLRVIASLMPRHAAFHLAATGDEVDAPWLAAAGLIARLSEPGELTHFARKYALELGEPAAEMKAFLRRRTAEAAAQDAAVAGPALAAILADQAAQRSTPS
jgi:enoyl-CoA hydratase/carnithine racemase